LGALPENQRFARIAQNYAVALSDFVQKHFACDWATDEKLATLLEQFAEVKDPVKDKLKRFGLLEQIGTDAFHPTIGAAVDAYLAEHAVDWKP